MGQIKGPMRDRGPVTQDWYVIAADWILLLLVAGCAGTPRPSESLLPLPRVEHLVRQSVEELREKYGVYPEMSEFDFERFAQEQVEQWREFFTIHPRAQDIPPALRPLEKSIPWMTRGRFENAAWVILDYLQEHH
ncbi:MAG: hypothetical protein ACE5JL_17005 [Dehalococcoidia bacterium]